MVAQLTSIFQSVPLFLVCFTSFFVTLSCQSSDTTQVVNIKCAVVSYYSPSVPDNILLNFTLAKGDVVVVVPLNLTRNPNIPANLPIFLTNPDGSPKLLTNLQSQTYYIDYNSKASILVTPQVGSPSNSNCLFEFTGSFQFGTDQYNLQPKDASRRRRRRRSPDFFHKISKAHISQPDYGNDGENGTEHPLPIPAEARLAQMLGRGDPSNPENLVEMSKTNFSVQLLVIIDYRLYSKWYNLSTALTDEGKMNDTVIQLRNYFTQIVNGVDLRYRSINDTSLSYQVSLAGIVIRNFPNISQFVEKNRFPSSSGSIYYVNAYNALFDIADFVNSIKPTLEQQNVVFDQATVVISDFLIGSTGSSLLGLGFYKAICSYYAVDIIRETGEYGTTETMAHELGHSLGAGHDGIDNTCSSTSNFIMVASPVQTNDANYKNAFTFSTCSVFEFKNYLSSFANSDNCLIKSQNIPSNTNFSYLGQTYSPDWQCRQILDAGSYYCGGASNDARICRSMSCYKSDARSCYSTYEMRAYTGTSCGNKKWCSMGDCVYDSRAPATKNYCLFGDTKAVISSLSGDVYCSNVTTLTWKCYDDAVNDACCATCSSLFNNITTGCEYGDRVSGCVSNDCQDPSRSAVCCRTCSNYSRTATATLQINPTPPTISVKTTPPSTVIPNTTISTPPTKSTSTIPTSASTSTSTSTSTLTSTSTSTSTSTTTTTTTTTTTKPTTTTTTTPTTTTTTTTTPTTMPTTRTTTTTTTTLKPTTTTTASQRPPYCERDSVPWCWSYDPSYCYTISYYCCNRCYYGYRDTGIQDCLYGDHYSWCSPFYCYSPYLKSVCCLSCKS